MRRFWTANGALLSVVAVWLMRMNFARTGVNEMKFALLIGPLAAGVHFAPSSDVAIWNARVVAGSGAVPRPAWPRPAAGGAAA